MILVQAGSHKEVRVTFLIVATMKKRRINVVHGSKPNDSGKQGVMQRKVRREVDNYRRFRIPGAASRFPKKTNQYHMLNRKKNVGNSMDEALSSFIAVQSRHLVHNHEQ